MTNVVIALSTAVVLGGEIHKAGEQIEVDKTLAQELLRRGRGTLVEVESDEMETLDLSKMKKAELVELALEYGIENTDSMTVAQLIEAIQAAAAE